MSFKLLCAVKKFVADLMQRMPDSGKSGIFRLSVCSLKYVMIKIYRVLILPVILCGCETCSFTLREECRLRVFENSRKIFGTERGAVMRVFENSRKIFGTERGAVTGA